MERAQRDYKRMSQYLITLSVDIDAAGIENAVEHASMAVEAEIMNDRHVREWLCDELDRFVIAGV